MKRKYLINKLLEAGYELLEGGNHTKVYKDNILITTIPRHKEINELTAKNIIKRTKI